MTAEVWLSLGLGSGIGVLYGTASIAAASLASRHGDATFMTVFFGGMVVRLFLAVLIITLVLVLVPIRAFVFLASFLLVFFAGLVLEVWLVHRGSVPSGPAPEAVAGEPGGESGSGADRRVPHGARTQSAEDR